MSPPPEHITLREVGQRDGLQNSRRLFAINECIERFGFVNPKRLPRMADADAFPDSADA